MNRPRAPSQNAAAFTRRMTKTSRAIQSDADTIPSVVDPSSFEGTSHMSMATKLSLFASLALIAALPASANMAPPEPAPATAPADPAATPADPAAAPTDPATPADPNAPATTDPTTPPTTEPPTTEAPPAETPTAETPTTEEPTTMAEAPAEGGGMGTTTIAAIVGGLVVLGGAGYWLMNRK